MPLPDAVYHHPCGERIGGVCNPVSQLQTAAALGDVRGFCRDDERKSLGDPLPGTVMVSTKEQTPDPQLDVLRQYAQARSLEVQGEYVDHGVSGARAKRPALDRLLAAARKRQIDALAIVKLDRLARSVRHLTELGAELETLGVDLIVIDQGIDTTTPAGRLLFNVLGSIAEFERDLIRERTLAGVAAARKRGATIGRPSAMDEEALARARRMRDSGKSLRQIGEMLGVGVATVHRSLGQ